MATTKKIARSKAGTKRATEKPVDAEIKRAADRTGLIATPATPPERPVAVRRDEILSIARDIDQAALSVIDGSDPERYMFIGKGPSQVLPALQKLRWASWQLRQAVRERGGVS